MNTIRVMIVEDSPTVREFLARAVRSDARLEVVAECASAEQALKCLERAKPDVISMDIHLPGMCGLEATRRIMEVQPTPIVIVSRSVQIEELATMDALRAGAVSAVEKPACRTASEATLAASRICRELATMSRVKVVRQRFNRQRLRVVTPLGERTPGPTTLPRDFGAAVVGIVASTGGPNALQAVLSSIGPDTSLPIVLVQHITASFHSGFITWLDRVSPQKVVEAVHGESMNAGHVYVAPADKHLAFRGSRMILVDGAPVSGQRPSGTVLLQSLAETYGSRAVGVVLTGMGNDGAEGLLAIREAGGYTITEDESTAIVNGMPEAARMIGASCATLPLESIGGAIRNFMPVLEGART